MLKNTTVPFLFGKLYKNLLFLFFILLFGCATSIQLTKENRESIRSVSVKKSVESSYSFMWEKEVVSYEPWIKQADIGSITGGLIGGLTGMLEDMKSEAKRKQGREFLNMMREADISVENIVRQQFFGELQSSKRFLVNQETEKADAEFSLSIKEFGVNRGFFALKYKPFIGVEAALKLPDGTTMWQKYVFVSYKNENVPPIAFDGEKVREAITVAAKIAAKELISNLKEEK